MFTVYPSNRWFSSFFILFYQLLAIIHVQKWSFQHSTETYISSKSNDLQLCQSLNVDIDVMSIHSLMRVFMFSYKIIYIQYSSSTCLDAVVTFRSHVDKDTPLCWEKEQNSFTEIYFSLNDICTKSSGGLKKQTEIGKDNKTEVIYLEWTVFDYWNPKNILKNYRMLK